ncbi:MAG: inosine/xanthosine triphosphatase [Caldilineaceae bacterium]
MQSIESVQGPTIAVGSTNPVKLNAARNVVTRVWAGAEVQAVDVPSGVAAQPLRDQDAITGACNRAQAARDALDADFGVGIEGNVDDSPLGMYVTGWAAVVDRHGEVGIGAGGRFLLPEHLAVHVRSGAELGALMDEIVNEDNTKQRQGAVGIFTGGLVDRTQALELAVIFALTRFVAPTLYTP